MHCLDGEAAEGEEAVPLQRGDLGEAEVEEEVVVVLGHWLVAVEEAVAGSQEEEVAGRLGGG